jgi:hypothetical protein
MNLLSCCAPKGRPTGQLRNCWKNKGVKTSVARVAEYGRIVLDSGKRRKRRKYTHATPTAVQTVPSLVKPFPPTPVVGETGGIVAGPAAVSGTGGIPAVRTGWG